MERSHKLLLHSGQDWAPHLKVYRKHRLAVCLNKTPAWKTFSASASGFSHSFLFPTQQHLSGFGEKSYTTAHGEATFRISTAFKPLKSTEQRVRKPVGINQSSKEFPHFPASHGQSILLICRACICKSACLLMWPNGAMFSTTVCFLLVISRLKRVPEQ